MKRRRNDRTIVRAVTHDYEQPHDDDIVTPRCPICRQELIACMTRRGPGYVCGCPEEINKGKAPVNNLYDLETVTVDAKPQASLAPLAM